MAGRWWGCFSAVYYGGGAAGRRRVRGTAAQLDADFFLLFSFRVAYLSPPLPSPSHRPTAVAETDFLFFLTSFN